jgi:hypothetical protein
VPCPEVPEPFFDILMRRNEQHPSAYYGNDPEYGTYADSQGQAGDDQ